MYKLHAHMQKVHKIDPISKEKLPCPWKARLAAMEKLVPDVETQKEVEQENDVEILENNQSETSQEPSAMVEALLEEEEDDEVQIIENNQSEASQEAGESIVEEENRENGQTEKWQDPIAVVFYNDAQDAPVAEESTQPQSQDDDDDEVEILETNQSAQWLGPTALIYSNGNPQAPVAEEPPLPQAQEQPGATPVNQVVENLLELLPNDI